MSDSENRLSKVTDTKLLAVIVIYKRLPSESPTLLSLLNAAQEISTSDLKLRILIQDNTPGGQFITDLPPLVRYEAASNNPGLADAYNRALDVATAEGFDWLLTLDQDTILPNDFLTQLLNIIRKLPLSPMISAILPHVTGDNRNISPFRLLLRAIPRRFPYGYTGIPQQATYAINSAATLRVSAIREISGYDPAFPLDISDLNLFHRLYLSGKFVFVAGNLIVHHDFSLLKKHSRMNVQRYQSLLLDECAFWDMNMGILARLERLARLAGRACKDLFTPEARIFQKLTLAELKRRIVTSRSRRIIEWKDFARTRAAASFVMPAISSKVLMENSAQADLKINDGEAPLNELHNHTDI
jgi:GT2 family glycosyltransferase